MNIYRERVARRVPGLWVGLSCMWAVMAKPRLVAPLHLTNDYRSKCFRVHHNCCSQMSHSQRRRDPCMFTRLLSLVKCVKGSDLVSQIVYVKGSSSTDDGLSDGWQQCSEEEQRLIWLSVASGITLILHTFGCHNNSCSILPSFQTLLAQTFPGFQRECVIKNPELEEKKNGLATVVHIYYSTLELKHSEQKTDWTI